MSKSRAVKLVLAFTGALSATSAQAATYQLTGDLFTLATGNYTTSMSVTGQFEVGSPLSANTPYFGFSPTTYSFNDGLQTFTESTGVIQDWNMTTNSEAEIIVWFITIVGGPFSSIFTSQNSDLAQYTGNPPGILLGNGLAATGGSWERTDISAVPLPAALPLFAAGLSAMGFMGWRRKRKALA